MSLKHLFRVWDSTCGGDNLLDKHAGFLQIVEVEVQCCIGPRRGRGGGASALGCLPWCHGNRSRLDRPDTGHGLLLRPCWRPPDKDMHSFGEFQTRFTIHN